MLNQTRQRNTLDENLAEVISLTSSNKNKSDKQKSKNKAPIKPHKKFKN